MLFSITIGNTLLVTPKMNFKTNFKLNVVLFKLILINNRLLLHKDSRSDIPDEKHTL